MTSAELRIYFECEFNGHIDIEESDGTTAAILDAVLIFPIAIIFWIVSSRRTKLKNETNEEHEIKGKDKSTTTSSFAYRSAFVWILFLFIAVILSAAGRHWSCIYFCVRCNNGSKLYMDMEYPVQ